jgi:2-haloacid dehalogenase
VADRWATFDCYGTIVDWNAGIGNELEHLFGVERRERLLERFHEIEPEIQASSPGASYREVLTLALERLASEEGLMIEEGETSALAKSLPSWPVFEDAAPALGEAKQRGWKLAILSNTDRDLLDASMEAIGVPFDGSIVAGEIGSYKPASRHWEVFREQTGVDAEHHVHVAQSLFHDIATATELGLPSVWINRLGEPRDERPDRTLSSLTGLADALDELVPA